MLFETQVRFPQKALETLNAFLRRNPRGYEVRVFGGQIRVSAREAKRKVNFTDKLVSALPNPEGGAVIYRGTTPALELHITKAGVRKWCARRHGAGGLQVLGYYPQMKTAEAKRLAAEVYEASRPCRNQEPKEEPLVAEG